LTPEELALNGMYARLREKRAADQSNLLLQAKVQEEHRKEALSRVMEEERVKEQARATRRQAEEARDKKREARQRLKDAKREGEEALASAEAEAQAAADAAAETPVLKKVASSFSKRHVKPVPPPAAPNPQLRRPMNFVAQRNSLVGGQNSSGGGKRGKQKHCTSILVTDLPRGLDAAETLEDVFRPYGDVDVMRMVSLLVGRFLPSPNQLRSGSGLAHSLLMLP
jgi:hypothetical protein